MDFLKHLKKEDPKNKKKRIIINALIVVFAAVFVFSAYKIIKAVNNYHVGDAAYSDVRDKAIKPADSSTPVPPIDSEGNPVSDSQAEVSAPDNISVDFDVLKSQNSEVAGWLYNKGTPISYPIVQGSDNDYYLTHRFDNVYSSFGTLFIDCRDKANFEGNVTTVYGHNMDNGSMFASLLKYKNQSYYDEHKEMMLYTEDATYKVQIFSAYTAATSDMCYTLDSTSGNISDYITYAESSSNINSDVTVSKDDKIIIFSTCSYAFNDARYVVVGKLSSP